MFIFRKNGHFYEKIGKKGEPVCIDDEIPFDIPDTWEWCKFENIIELISGRDLKKTQYNDLKKGIPYVTGASNIINNQLLINRWTEEPAVIAIKKDILLSCKGTIGKILILNEDKVHIARQIMSVRLIDETLINREYIVIFLMYHVNNLINIAKSMIPGISREDVLKINIPLPPLNEQKRMVKEINKLNPLINEYGINKKKLDKLNSEFPDKLKSSILQEAIQGKLVPQDSTDEPASVLLEKIRDEKERLIKEKKIKRNKNESFIYKNNTHFYERVGKNGDPICIDDEIPFDIPDNWEWTRIKNIVTKLTDGAHKTPKYVDKGIPFLSVKDMSSGYLDFSDTKYISQEDFERIYQRCNYEYGDILLTKVGTTGIPIIIDTNKDFGLFVSVALLKFNHEFIYNEFLVHLINSPLVQLQCIENTKGVGNKNWVLRDIGNTLITIPPLNEQIRIVEKLEEIFQKLK